MVWMASFAAFTRSSILFFIVKLPLAFIVFSVYASPINIDTTANILISDCDFIAKKQNRSAFLTRTFSIKHTSVPAIQAEEQMYLQQNG